LKTWSKFYLKKIFKKRFFTSVDITYWHYSGHLER